MIKKIKNIKKNLSLVNWKEVDYFKYLAISFAAICLILFIFYPIFSTLMLSGVPRGEAVSIENLSFANFTRFLTSRLFRISLVNSLKLSFYVTALSTFLGVTFAFILARAKLPINKTLIMTLGTLPLISPPFIGAYSWIEMLGRNGFITRIIENLTNFTIPSIYGFPGMVLAMTVTRWPLVFLLCYGALSIGDPSLEESADVMGASTFRKLRTITFPMVFPALGTGAVMAFMRSIGDFGTPAILGGDIYVIPTLIYFQLTGYFDRNAASAIAIVVIIISIFTLLLLRYFMRRKDYISVTSEVQKTPEFESKLFGILGSIFCIILIGISLLPQFVVIFGSFSTRWVNTLWPTEFGLGNYASVFTRNLNAIQNSLFLAVVATIIATIFSTMLAYMSSRDKTKIGKFIDSTVMLPFVLPGIVVGVAILTSFSPSPFSLAGTGIILIIAYTVRRMPYGFRSAVSALEQTGTSMEEASFVCGASWLQTTRRITVPLILPAIISGAIMTFITLIGELSSTIILYSARWTTMTVSIFQYLISHRPGPAFALGTIIIIIVFSSIIVINILLGKSMVELFGSD